MVESHHLGHEVFEKDTKHPDLLISHRSTWALIHSVFAEGIHEACFEVIDHSLVHVDHLSLVSPVDSRRWGPHLAEDWAKSIEVCLKEFMQLVEVSDASHDSLSELAVCLNQVFLVFYLTIQDEQLEVRLSVASLSSAQKHLLGFV